MNRTTVVRGPNLTRRVASGLAVAAAAPAASNAEPSAHSALPLPPGFRVARVRVGDLTLNVTLGGEGDALVLLHGWPETSAAWRKVMPALAAKHSIIAPDLRGFGDSDRPADGYDRRTMAADVRALVQVLGHSTINLAGHDWGGSVATSYALHWPSEVRRLAVLEAMPKGPWSAAGEEPWFYALHRDVDFAEALTVGRERLYLSWFYRSFSAVQDAVGEAEIAEYVRCYSRPGAMRPGFQLVRGLERDVQDNSAALAANGKLAMPVLAVGGDRSMGSRVAENLSHAAVTVHREILPDTGHFVPEERPAELSGLLLDFFGPDGR